MQTGADSPPKKSSPTLFNLIILHVFWTVSSLSSAEPFHRGWNQLCACLCSYRPRELNWGRRRRRRREADSTQTCLCACALLHETHLYSTSVHAHTHTVYSFTSLLLSLWLLSSPSCIFSSVFSLSSSFCFSFHFYTLWPLLLYLPSFLRPLCTLLLSHLTSPPLRGRGKLKWSGCCGKRAAAGVNGFCLDHFNIWLRFCLLQRFFMKFHEDIFTFWCVAALLHIWKWFKFKFCGHFESLLQRVRGVKGQNK